MNISELLLLKAKSKTLSWADEQELAQEFALSFIEVERKALALGITPSRYQRNMVAITIEEQLVLNNSAVGVIGCGGLGGYVIENLARLGIGKISVWDGDVFEEHNLNRQILSDTNLIGESKIEAAKCRVKAINPSILFHGYQQKIDKSTPEEFLTNHKVLVDAVDNIKSRMVISDLGRRSNLPVVHGAVGGWWGQVSTQYPGDGTLEKIYADAKSDKGMELSQGTLAFSASAIASLQVAEVIKIILGRGSSLRQRLLVLNLLDMEMDIFDL
ncbi:MAG: HesA/MoeB/ThiF family protein [Chitinophagales bacterium]